MVQQFQLLGRRVDLFAVHDQLIGIQINGQLVKMELLAGVIGDLRPPQNGVDPGDQFLHLKGLDDVVIRAHFKALDPVKDLALGRQHDDGHLAGLPDLGADRPTVHHRQHDVQQDQVRLLFLELLQCLPSVSGNADVKAFLYQIHMDQVGDILIVFYNQNVASHRVSSVLRGLPVPFLMFFSTLYYPKLRRGVERFVNLASFQPPVSRFPS